MRREVPKSLSGLGFNSRHENFYKQIHTTKEKSPLALKMKAKKKSLRKKGGSGTRGGPKHDRKKNSF